MTWYSVFIEAAGEERPTEAAEDAFVDAMTTHNASCAFGQDDPSYSAQMSVTADTVEGACVMAAAYFQEKATKAGMPVARITRVEAAVEADVSA